MSTPEPTEPAPTSEAPETEAELYAASAAENALPSDKNLPDEPGDLSALSGALDAVALSDEETKEEIPATTEETAVSTAEDEPKLTKEEMIEEALNCPCIATMKDGPCGDSFVAAYRCFLESETEPKGMDCMEQFTGMQSCMSKHPEEYADDDDDDPFSVSDKKGSETRVSDEKGEDKTVKSDDAPSPAPPAQVSS